MNAIDIINEHISTCDENISNYKKDAMLARSSEMKDSIDMVKHFEDRKLALENVKYSINETVDE